MEAEDEIAKQNQHPFANISGIKIIAGAIASFFILIFLIPITENLPSLRETDSINIIISVFFGGILVSILLQFRKHPLLWNYVLKAPVQTESWKILLIVIPLLMLSIGTAWLWDLMLLQLFPSYLESQWRSENLFVDPDGGFISFSIATFAMVIIAPIVEEILFRGVIFDKISSKWSIKAGVISSSLIFGLLHTDPIGAFVFGAVLCLIYLQMNSLLIPIICHTLNNLIVVLVVYSTFIDATSYETREQLYQEAWICIPLLLIGIISLVWFVDIKHLTLKNLSTEE